MSSQDKAGLRFAVLGPVRAWHDGHELDLGSPQQRAVLAALLLRGGRLATAEELIDGLWGEEPPLRAIGTIRTYVSRLRQVLGDALQTGSRGYLLRRPPGSLDLEAAEHAVAHAAGLTDQQAASASLRQALDAWHGEPLAGLPGPYAAAQRNRLAELRLSILDTRLDLDLRLGRAGQVAGELAALAAAHPLRERFRELHMTALHQAGRAAEALQVYAEVRELLADELGADPGPALQEVHRQILTGELPVPAQHRVPQPAQLPADLPDFTGRAGLTAELAGLLTGTAGHRKGLPVVALSGPGGSGKTALAVHLAHLVRDDFAGGQLYVDLLGMAAEPLDPAEVLTRFLRALGVPAEAIPDQPADRAALYRSTVAGHRILVVLDNAADLAQVTPLLPGTPECAVLVTARHRLPGLPAHAADLDLLTLDESRDLLRAVIGTARADAEPEATTELVELCGRLPLALRIVAARLATRPAWRLEAMAGRLRDERSRLDVLRVGDLAVEASIRLGYAQLEPEAARAFRLLATPDAADISARAAAAVLGLDPGQAEAIAEELVDASLLASAHPGRYQYHDLVRATARRASEALDGAGERETALHRLLDHQLASVKNLLQAAIPATSPLIGQLAATSQPGDPIGDRGAAREWLATEYDGLLATCRQQPGALAADLLFGLIDTLHWQPGWSQAEQVARQVAAETAKAGLPIAEARARYAAWTLLAGRGRVAEADTELTGLGGLTGLRELCREAGDPVSLARASKSAGTLAWTMNRPAEAADLCAEAQRLFQDIGYLTGEADALANQALALGELGRYPEALAAGRRARDLHREAGGVEGEGHALHVLGRVARQSGDLELAIGYHKESLAIYRAEGYHGRGMGWMLIRLAEAHVDARQSEEALACAEEAAQILGLVGDEAGLGQALGVTGTAYAITGEPDLAASYWRDGHDLLRRAGHPAAAHLAALLDAPAAC
ncbi:AfsR/SARP family transcriptional regulator [Longispora albida]|uniref:AfsR/SARP family transcriptional regulator n=1 Tax=Longispora albida TaxID=203523 RepID=UPI0003A4CE8C|nr:BTAD domain-containing putative transcriptional regulator [Longispora albida]